MDTDRPTLTPDDCHALREFSGMTWCVRGRWVSMGEILDSWVDATMRAQYSASARAEALAARVAELEKESAAWQRMYIDACRAASRYQTLFGTGGHVLEMTHARTLEKNARLRRHIERLLSICRARKAEAKNLVWRDDAATRERVGWIEECRRLTARVAELEAELSATERTADAERERAKRAERLLESESARVAELEAENERLRDIGEDLCINMGAFIGAHECPSQEVIRRWDTATGQDNAGSNLRAYSADCAGPAPNSAEPTTRPLTTADRLPEIGDVISGPGGRPVTCDLLGAANTGRAWRFVLTGDAGEMRGGVYLTSRALHDHPHEYASRADGGPVTVEGADGG